MNLAENHKKNDEITLKEFVLKIQLWWNYILSKWRLILAVSVIGGIMGLVYSYLKAPIYKAQLSFALEDDKSNGGISGALSLATQFGFDLGGGGGSAFSGDNLLELMKSRSMVEKTLLTSVNINGNQQTLAELYISFNKLREKWTNVPKQKTIQFSPGANRSEFTLQQDSVLGVFYTDIIRHDLAVVKTDKKLSIISVKVASKNELFSKYFTEILAKTVSDFYISTKTKKSVQNVAILQHQTDSVRQELNGAINSVASFIDATPNANPGRQILRTSSQRRQVDVQANQAILTELVKNLELSKMSLRKETPLIQIIDQPILPLEKEKVGKLKSIVVGGVLMAFCTTLYLVIKQIFKKLITD